MQFEIDGSRSTDISGSSGSGGGVGPADDGISGDVETRNDRSNESTDDDVPGFGVLITIVAILLVVVRFREHVDDRLP
ncbi:PGF-CTERM sorting domain-containing protein [Natrialba swarupiae]|uniref:PGF-CTERM sorting domain-containing protein n=1 Tax=Natrialba swarupiae TaxID=2448032 RepID=A0A5D5AT14_9EURY|nr:PGF-CTERM sorting domain-containing protein [Natrialba swarupiae]